MRYFNLLIEMKHREPEHYRLLCDENIYRYQRLNFVSIIIKRALSPNAMHVLLSIIIEIYTRYGRPK